MSSTVSSIEIVSISEILAIGFQKKFEQFLSKFPFWNNGVKIREFENSFIAYRWLVHCAKKQNRNRLPKAIVCDYQILKQEKFLLLRNLKGHQVLREIPLIAINNSKNDVRKEAMQAGIDDCYSTPVNWKAFLARIEFLEKYKTLLNHEQDDFEESYDLEIPFSKRLLDILFSSFSILLFSPIYFILALLIRLESKGPILYRSKRVGTGYQVFNFLKFRSMYMDADQRLKEFQHLNQYSENKDLVNSEGLFLKLKNDPRVTRVGRIIRKTSLDELPQFFNVLRGDMSIVGNRPLPLYEAEQLTRDEWAQRFLAPAGITGLWQVTKRGKNTMSTKERIALDIKYAETYSFWNDLKIIFKTPFAMFQEENV